MSTPESITSPAAFAAFVLGYNNPDDSIECLASLAAQSARPSLLLYVDNGSEPENRQRVRDAFPESSGVQFLCFDDNLGFATAWNRGLETCIESGADLVLAANNDLVFPPDCLAELTAAAAAHPGAGILTPKITYHHAPEHIWSAALARRAFPPTIIHRKTKGPDSAAFDMAEDVEYLTLCTVLLRAAAVRVTGLLDPTFLFYCEDTDYSVRVREAGFTLRYVPSARVLHKSPVIGESRRGNDRFFRHYGRSETIFCRKHPAVYPGIQGLLHFAYIQARCLYEGGLRGLRVFRRGRREGKTATLLPVPQIKKS